MQLHLAADILFNPRANAETARHFGRLGEYPAALVQEWLGGGWGGGFAEKAS